MLLDPQVKFVRADGWLLIDLSTARRELWEEGNQRGAVKIHVKPTTLEFLVNLLQRPGEVVSNAALLPRTDRRSLVDQVNSCLNELRDRLGKNYVDKHIEHVTATGCCFHGQVELLDEYRNVVRNFSTNGFGSDRLGPRGQDSPDVPSQIDNIRQVTSSRRPATRYSPTMKVISAVSVTALVVALGTIPLLLLNQHPRGFVAPGFPSPRSLQPVAAAEPQHSPAVTTIWLANLDGPESERYRTTERVFSDLKDLEKTHRDISVDKVAYRIREDDGTLSSTIREMRQKGVSLLIWGWYALRAGQVYVRLRFEFPLNNESRDLDITALDNFNVDCDLSNRVSAISLVTDGFLQFSRNNFAGAERALRDALSRHAVGANVPVISMFLGNAQLLQGHDKEALETLRPIIGRTWGERITLFAIRAQAFTQNGDRKSAKRDLDSAIAIGQRYTRDHTCDSNLFFCRMYSLALMERGTLLAAEGNTTAAAKDLLISTQVAHNPVAAFTRTAVLDQSSVCLQHIPELCKKCEFDPTSSAAYSNRGLLEYCAGHYPKALYDVNRAISLAPEEPRFYGERGILEQRLGLHDAAARDFDLAAQRMRKSQELLSQLPGLCQMMEHKSQFCPN